MTAESITGAIRTLASLGRGQAKPEYGTEGLGKVDEARHYLL